MIGRVFRDVRDTVRQLGRSPVFTLTAVASLAIGIGANTTIFSVANALLVAPPPGVREPDRLIDIGASRDGAGFDTLAFPTYQDVQARSQLLDGVYAVGIEPRPLSLRRDNGADAIDGQFVSAGFFDVLGVAAARGQVFHAAEERVGVPLRTVVLSDACWRRAFGGDAGVVGRTVVLNGDAFTVIGIAPAAFRGTTILAPDLWLPLTAYGHAMPDEALTRSRGSAWIVMGARMKPRVTIDQVRAEMASIDRALAAEFPDAYARRALVVAPASRVPGFAGEAVTPILVALMAVVGLVLLVACTNLAGLMLARAAARSREMAVRLALGATRGHLIRQLLAESLVVFVAGGLTAIVLTRWLTAVLWSLLPTLPVPIALDFAIDGRVLTFTAGLALVTGLVTGLAPALYSSRANLVADLKTETTPRRQRLRHVFLSTQLAFCLLLLVTAGLFLRALGAALSVNPGFDVDPIDVVTIDLALGGYDRRDAPRVTEELRGRFAGLPGVEAVAVGAVVPLEGTGMGLGALRKPGADPRDEHEADWNVISPEFLPAFGLALVNGRNFSPADREGAPLAAIVNERLANRLWPHQDPIGQRLENQDATVRTFTIVGVARDARYRWLGDRPRDFIYVPMAQQPWLSVKFFLRRDAASLAHAVDATTIRQAVKAFNANLPVVQVLPLREFANLGLLPQRVAAAVAGSLGVVALVLAAIGIYGVAAFAVAQRTREIGIRMALGANPRAVLRLIVGQTLRIAVIGGAAGLIAAAGLSTLLSDLLFGVSPVDPIAFGSMAATLAAVALAASYVPARRAARVDPVAALRSS